MNTPWTWELDVLRRRIAQGWSPEQVAVAVGRTRSAVIGQAYRLGLEWKTGNGAKRGQIKARREERKAAARRGGCQWIEAEPSADDACKCGEPVQPGRSYCPEHYRRAYIRMSPKAAMAGADRLGVLAEHAA